MDIGPERQLLVSKSEPEGSTVQGAALEAAIKHGDLTLHDLLINEIFASQRVQAQLDLGETEITDAVLARTEFPPDPNNIIDTLYVVPLDLVHLIKDFARQKRLNIDRLEERIRQVENFDFDNEVQVHGVTYNLSDPEQALEFRTWSLHFLERDLALAQAADSAFHFLEDHYPEIM